MRSDEKRRVLVLIRSALDEAKASQGLRAAVAYAALGIEVTVAITHDENTAPQKIARHLSTLRALSARIMTVDATGICALCDAGPWHAAVVW